MTRSLDFGRSIGDVLTARRPISISSLPEYLQDIHRHFPPDRSEDPQVFLPDALTTDLTSASKLRPFYLLLYREWLTSRLAEHGGCYPPLVLQRARVHEALAYDELAAFDAFVVYTLCLKELSDEFVTDLQGHSFGSFSWPLDSKDEVRALKVQALAVLVRTLSHLGATKDAAAMLLELNEDSHSLENTKMDQDEWPICKKPHWTTLSADGVEMSRYEDELTSGRHTYFGYARREIYPWSSYEPSRNSSSSIQELNQYLSNISQDLEAKISALPQLNTAGEPTGDFTSQLGLFARRDLLPGSLVLAEKSILTAIRPLDDAICDACGSELEGIPFEDIKQCEGHDCDVTFCSQECKSRAETEYHQPQLVEDSDDECEGQESEENEDPPHYHEALDVRRASNPGLDPSAEPKSAPFCGNQDLSTIGRPANTETPEWDLYFLLLTRTISMSITQKKHALDLAEIKYLWGDFNPVPSFDSENTSPCAFRRTLPFSLKHNLQYTLDFFTELSLSYPDATPYSASWIQYFDFWILQTLFAKFRGVANATQSTFDGKPEIASVHPGWCLANHSCAPNVRWTPKGTRKFFVRTAEERTWEDAAAQTQWVGIKAGEEIFSHYTDVRLPVEERRDRLRDVLGGNCLCERCVAESHEA